MQLGWLEYEEELIDRGANDDRYDSVARPDLSVSGYGSCASDLSRQSKRATDQKSGWSSHRFATDRPAVYVTRIFSFASVGGRRQRLRRRRVIRFEPWTNEPEVDRSGKHGCREVAGRESGYTGADRSGHDVRVGTRSPHLACCR